VKKSLTNVLALFVVSALVLAGCAQDEAQEEPVPTAEPAPFATAPLTGITYPTGAKEAEFFDAPAVSCKVDNVRAGMPQLNLNKSDIVFVQMVEGGLTRLVSVWHSTPVDAVGPVRSVRPMDADTVAAIGGIFCFSGGVPIFINPIIETGVYMADETSEKKNGSFSRSSSRPAPHNVIVDVALLQSQHLDRGAPGKVFDFAAFNAESESYEPASTDSGAEFVSVSVKYPGALSLWQLDGKGYLVRDQDGSKHMDAATDEQVKTKNVVVLQVQIDTSIKDAKAGYIPRTILIDSGPAWVFSDGKMVQGTWSKASQASAFELKDEAGNLIKLAPGNTWVELMPAKSTITIK